MGEEKKEKNIFKWLNQKRLYLMCELALNTLKQQNQENAFFAVFFFLLQLFQLKLIQTMGNFFFLIRCIKWLSRKKYFLKFEYSLWHSTFWITFQNCLSWVTVILNSVTGFVREIQLQDKRTRSAYSQELWELDIS